MSQPLYFQWSVSNLFGWGVYGLNLLRHWKAASGTQAYCIGQIHLDSLSGMDPLSLISIAQPLVDSDAVRTHIQEHGHRSAEGIVLHSLGNGFAGAEWPGQGGFEGTAATCGVIFFENTLLPDARAIAGAYDLIVCGSSWNEQILRANGVENVATVIQGVDLSLFHPAPRADTLEGRFAVFSGGKIETRKGQDLVVQAFRVFAQRHPEAILVTAWHSPWAAPALTVNGNPGIAPLRLTDEGKIDMAGWIADNGIPESQYFDLGPIPNHLMARVLREMDVAVFPNRCEGGTNLVAMEAMACGVPSIISANTGQLDLTATGAPYVLERQGEVASDDGSTIGWGESDVEEIVEALERAWSDREEAKRRGAAGAEAMAKLSWRRQIAGLHKVLAPLGA